ncbi:MAG TPA: exodeoxyribonuclease VII small subunit [Gemmatimonadaceae bacterium]|nr:exodeoxyribonuclease VII small subunit [Gemmatimonadaceae bacterium]
MSDSRRKQSGGAGTDTFESELARLEAIVEELQDDSVELDAALRLFEEGVRRLRAVTSRLASAEAKIKVLTEDEDGFGLADFDA